MKIATWNVNSLKVRKDIVYTWLELNNDIDFLLLQEIKGNDSNNFNIFDKLGYNCFYNLQKTYNGVAIIAKKKYDCIEISAQVMPDDPQARFLHIQYKKLNLINIYVPNGNPVNTEKLTYKKIWLSAFFEYIHQLLSNNNEFIIGGDFNIAPYDHDVYDFAKFKDDALCIKDIRDAYFSLLNSDVINVIDFIQNKTYAEKNIEYEKFYTWWDYRENSFIKNHGARIDHLLLSSFYANYLVNAEIDQKPRAEHQPSDHTPLICEINI